MSLLMPTPGTTPPPYLTLRLTGECPHPDHSPRGYAAEVQWLPSLGPTALFAARRIYTMAVMFDPENVRVELDKFADAMGVGPRVLARALDRLVIHKLAEWELNEVCPRFSMLATWPEAPLRGRTAAYSFKPMNPTERTPNGDG